MRYLIDTHTFLWFINDNPQLTADVKNLLESDVDVLLSVASLWEIAIKVSLGKLSLPDVYERFMPQQIAVNDIDVLPISVEHLSIVATLPFHHRDPFDRLIIAQAIVEQVEIISVDGKFDAYPVKRLW